MDDLLRWWDGVEFWVADQGFLPQVLLMLLVAVPLAWIVAGALDQVVLSGQIRGRKSAPGERAALPKSWVSWALVALLGLVLIGWMVR